MSLPTRSIAPWLTPDERRRAGAVIERAIKDIGLCEMPPGSNRSPRIDSYLRAVHVPESVIKAGKGYWCAAATSAWWREAGVRGLPGGVGSASCDVWMTWAKVQGLFDKVPTLGALVLYGKPGDAQHIGLVIRVSPVVLTIEGNTTVEGAAFGASRNGIAVSQKEVTAKDPVLGYVRLP